jgi:glycosyltransferase involved in cell wall biosynthesis
MKDNPVPLPGNLPGKPTLSVCMIVRHEERALPQCLKSVQAVGDGIIVVDTGSKDRTVAVAKNFGAKVFQFTWQDASQRLAMNLSGVGCGGKELYAK